MGWLVTQMWLWLALAALFGGLIGWALRTRRTQRDVDLLAAQRDAAMAQVKASSADGAASPEREDRLSKLEAALTAERETVSQLKSQIADSPNEPPSEEDDGSITWRNRYLESRVRYLEGKLADADAAAAPAASNDDESMRLKWRNRYLEGRVKYLEEDAGKAAGLGVADAQAFLAEPTAANNDEPAEDDAKPPALDAPRAGGKDDLKAVGGIGPKIEKTLNDLGVFHFDQIAAWTRKEIDWVDGYLSFKGRIDRENWIEQCAALAAGDAEGAKAKAKAGKAK